MVKTPFWTIPAIVGCTLLLATGQVLMKSVLDKNAFSQVLYNPLFLLSVALYIGSGILIILVLKHGSLSTLYPFISLGFIWVTLASILILHEQISTTQAIGISAIISGVSIIGHAGTRRRP